MASISEFELTRLADAIVIAALRLQPGMGKVGSVVTLAPASDARKAAVAALTQMCGEEVAVWQRQC